MNKQWVEVYTSTMAAFGGTPEEWDFTTLLAEEAAEFDLIEQGILPDNGRYDQLLDLADSRI